MKIDYKNPDYMDIFAQRNKKLKNLRKSNDPKVWDALKLHYKDNPIDFICDWGCTLDPRNVELGLPTTIPFLLFDAQKQMAAWILERWKSQENGAIVKSREVGASWVFIALMCTLGLFHHGFCAGFGSRKEDLVDRLSDPNTLFEKARQFLQLLPKEFRGSFDRKKHSSHMKILFPDTGSLLAGDAGDNLGRGARYAIYGVDEAAFLTHPELVDRSLTAATNCRIDISTPQGSGNPFATKVAAGKIPVFYLHWRDDPRKDEAWYQKKCQQIDDPVIIAQELDMSFTASLENSLINHEWIQSAIDAHVTLGLDISGARLGALDVADQGRDKNAFCIRYGIMVEHLEEWSGAESDLYATTERTLGLCDQFGCDTMLYDADGLGVAIRGDGKRLNDKRDQKIKIVEFRGSGPVFDPEKDPYGMQHNYAVMRTNKDFFANYKAQSYWKLRDRFKNTHKAVTVGKDYDPENLISIPRSLKNCLKLTLELTQIQAKFSDSTGKLVIDKTPDGTRSPNLADSVMMAFSSQRQFRAFLLNGKSRK